MVDNWPNSIEPLLNPRLTRYSRLEAFAGSETRENYGIILVFGKVPHCFMIARDLVTAVSCLITGNGENIDILPNLTRFVSIWVTCLELKCSSHFNGFNCF